METEAIKEDQKNGNTEIPLQLTEQENLESQDIPQDDLSLSGQLTRSLGRPANYEITHRKSQGVWTFLCGRPLEIDGSPFDYKTSKLSDIYAEGLGDDSFCALLKSENDQQKIMEFDIGSNDMPALEWIETYGIPAEILDD